MSDQDNPYKAPETTASTNVPEGDLYLPDPVRIPLLKTAPWKRFLGIVGFVMSGLIAVVGLFMIIGVSAMASALDLAGMGGGMGVFMGLLYVGMAALYFFPSLYLFRSGKLLKAYQSSSSSGDLVDSLTNASRFWKFVGVLTIIYLGFMAVMLVILGIVAVAGGF